MEPQTSTGKALDKFGYMIGVKRYANEPDDAYKHRIYIARKCVCSSPTFDSMTDDLADICALVVHIKTNLTWSPTPDIPPQSFIVTVVGGNRNDIAQCIHDNRSCGVASFGDTSGVATNGFGNATTEWFNHIEMDYISRAINFMEKWQPIVYDIYQLTQTS